MTRTEERLQDALRASASRVKDDRLRPLPDRQPAPARNRRRLRRAWRSWAGPAAAAASVALLVGLVVAVTGGLRTGAGPGHGRVAGPAIPPGLPRYFASFSGPTSISQFVVVRSTRTGAVAAQVATPEAPPHEQLADDALAAAPDDHTFYVEYDTIPVTDSSQIRIYTFSITSSGSATPMTPVNGGTFVGRSMIAAGSMAVSPDGSDLALTATRSLQQSQYADFSDQIVVIDLRTGARSSWQGGLDRPGRSLSIADLSWAPGSRSLVFLAQWCASPDDECTGGPGPGNYRDAQARSVSVASSGGALGLGPVLLRTSARYPVIVQAFAGPDGGDVTALVLSGPVSTLTNQARQVVVEHISAATGSVLGTEYRTVYQSVVGLVFWGGRAALIWISPDPTGRYLLFSHENGYGFYTGWLGQGELHPVPVGQSFSGPAW